MLIVGLFNVANPVVARHYRKAFVAAATSLPVYHAAKLFLLMLVNRQTIGCQQFHQRQSRG
jgi:hypothetical protein